MADVPVMLTLTPVSVEDAVRFPPTGVPVHSSSFGAIEVQGAVPVVEVDVEVDVVDDVVDVVEVVVVVLRQITFTNIPAESVLGSRLPAILYP
ncbi:MAG: hypothetical protein ABSB29_05340 [Nitrososphaerales archaeon]